MKFSLPKKICAAVTIGLALVGCSTPEPATPITATTRIVTPAENTRPAPPGEAVRDGKFEFKVLKFGTAPSVGDEYAQAAPQGVFLIVEMSVSNIGNEPKGFAAGNQKLFIDGREYAADSLASIYLESSSVDINPGNSAVVQIAFDIPSGTEFTDYVELHDSMFSQGVELELQ